MTSHEVVIDQDGAISLVYSDSLLPVLEELEEAGHATRRRVSNVEPTGPRGRWVADMGPAGGPCLDNGGEGFRVRQDALDAELEWLRVHVL